LDQLEEIQDLIKKFNMAPSNAFQPTQEETHRI
jgi:hypothetical protein